MKKLFVVLMLSICFTALKAEEQKFIKSKIKEVTVFLSGAQVTRSGSISLPVGTYEVVFNDLSPSIMSNSIQASGKGNFTILSVVHQMNYLRNQDKSKEQVRIEDSLNIYQQQLDYNKGLLTVYTQETNMILANQSLGGANTGVKAADIKEAADFFRTRLSEIKMKQIELGEKIIKTSERLALLKNQLAVMNGKRSTPSSEVVVTVHTKAAATADISISYLVNDAGWIPAYDLRAIDINKPIELNYKANVYQSSGEEWKDTKLILSTGNPNQSGSKPYLNPWYLTFYQAVNYRNQFKPASASRAQEVEKEETVSEMYIDAVSMKSVAQTTASYTQVVESQTNVSFEISIPYTIASDGKEHNVEIQNYSLPAEFEYYCAPKLDRDAFLMAKVTGWDQYNLISGEINLFFEGTYVGKSYLETRAVKDTLDISLGRDKNIAVTRVKLTDYSSSAFVGLNKKELTAWEINVRNKKKQDIKIIIEDQFPITTEKDIEVDRIELSGGTFNKDTGIVQWKLNLKAGEASPKLVMKYEVKYPKNKTVIIN